jgi:hypothetical protein
MYLQKVISRKNCVAGILKVNDENSRIRIQDLDPNPDPGSGSESRSGSMSQRHGSADPNPGSGSPLKCHGSATLEKPVSNFFSFIASVVDTGD